MTSQGRPRTTFRRALERGNLVVAEDGKDNKHIDLLDGQGVNMAASQALYKLVLKQQALVLNSSFEA